MIQAVDLTKIFLTPKGESIRAVSEASFTVERGEVFGLLGPNGAGKTTLLRMLGTIITPTSGYCVVGNARGDKNPEAVRRNTGFLSGNTKLYARLTVRETLRYFGRLYGLEDAHILARTEQLARALDFVDLLDRRCEGLSTGQLQKASVARAMLHEPDVLIFDEPTLGLDILTSRTVLDFILESKTHGRSVVLSTHYLTEAELVCDRIGFIHSGRIMAQGTKPELYDQTGTDNLKDAFFRLADQGEGRP